jgi:hypothetical protein
VSAFEDQVTVGISSRFLPGESLAFNRVRAQRFGGDGDTNSSGASLRKDPEGLVEELRSFLTQQVSAYVKSPELYIRPVGYRPVRIYVGGEVKRPGYFTLSSVEAPLLSSSQHIFGNDYVQTTNPDGSTSWRPRGVGAAGPRRLWRAACEGSRRPVSVRRCA